MENRERDKLSRSDHSTEAGDINRETSARKGREKDSSADFGQSIGRSESPRGNVPSGRNSGAEGYGSSSGRNSSSGSMSGGRSRNSESDVMENDRSGNSSEGRH
jgi:hypothetical protein